MRYLSVLLLIGFVGVAVFGVFNIHQGGMSDHNQTSGDCIAATTKGMDCPKEADPISFAVFHLDAFRDFSIVTLGENSLALISTLLLLVAGVFFGILKGKASPPQLNFAYSRYRLWEFFRLRLKRRLLGYLALHENSPTIS